MLRPLLISLVLTGVGISRLAAFQQEPPDELVQYIRDANKAGLKADQITKNATQAGWTKPMVDQALELVLKPQKPHPDSEEKAKPGAQAEPAKTSMMVDAKQPAETPSAAEPAKIPQSPTNAQVATAAGGDRTMHDEYRIGEGDVIQVNVWGEREASVASIVVRPDGMITMPLIKDTKVAGLTPAEAEKVIAEPLSKLIKAADVTVIVNQINSKKVFMVGGGVKKEGPIPYTYRMTVMQALSEAGGLTDYAKRKKIYVLRNENGRQFKLPFDYDAVLKGEHMELNIPLQAGDTLVVPNH
jgi:polysaccharide export outer membrane protein